MSQNLSSAAVLIGALRVNASNKILVFLILIPYDKTKKCVSMKCCHHLSIIIFKKGAITPIVICSL